MTNIAEHIARLSPDQRALLERKLLQTARPSRDLIPRLGQEGPVEASFSQRKIWLMAQLDPANSALHVVKAIRLSGHVEVSALQRALDAVVARHEPLRTSFALQNEKLMQIVGQKTAEFSLLDLRGEETSTEKMDRLLTQESQRSFDLRQDVMLRATLYQLAADEWVLLLTLHHIAVDGSSLEILGREIPDLYKAYCANVLPNLPELPVSYCDYSAWQRERLTDDFVASHLAWWRTMIPRAPEPISWPRTGSRTESPQPKSRRASFCINQELYAAGATLARQSGQTFFIVLNAAFAAYLSRFTGQNRFVLGVPVAHRERIEIEQVVGCFFDVMPLCIHIPREATLRELIAIVSTAASGIYVHQEVHSELLPRDFRRYQVLSAYSQADDRAWKLSGLSVKPIEVESPRAFTDLTLAASRHQENIRCRLDWDDRLFDPWVMQRAPQHFLELLEAGVTDPERPIKNLRLMPLDEYSTVRRWGSGRVEKASQSSTIDEAFRQQLVRTPESIAAICGNQSITYRELDQRANQIANFLRRAGVREGNFVAVHLDRSIEMLAGLLGVLKSGAAYVPLDPAYPEIRLLSIIRHSGACAIITRGQTSAANLNFSGPALMQLDQHANEIANESIEAPEISRALDPIAYVLYTSGSTGQPKAVVGLHRAAMNRFRWMWSEFPFATDEVCSVKTSLGFIDSVWEIFGPLLAGVPLVLIPQTTVEDPRLLIEALASSSVTRIVLVPSLLESMLDSGLRGERSDLRICVSSGEELPSALARRFCSAMPRTKLINLYGSSEITGDVTSFVVENLDCSRSVPIGRPIWNTTVGILDSNLEPVPPGWPGVLYVSGANLAQGYLHDEELTSAKFLPNILDADAAGSMFNTGDVARFLPDGNLEYLGRADRQVKIRGIRVELDEIEHLMEECPEVRVAAALLRQGSHGDARIVCHVEPHSGTQISTAALREFAELRLPRVIVPAQFVVADRLPLTASGKIDHVLLSRMEVPLASTEEPSFREVGNRLEDRLIQIWQEVLGISRISLDDNFIDLGGHSLLAVKLAVLIERRMGVRIPLARLFAAGTVRRLALEVERSAGEVTPALSALRSSGLRPPFFLLSYHLPDHAALQELGPDQPSFALDHFEPKRTGEPLTVQQIAGLYLNKIREVQPKGPYFFGGSCLDAVVTFEMARQIIEAGDYVGLLVLFDPIDVGFCRNRFPEVDRWLYRLHRQVLKTAYRIKRLDQVPRQCMLPFLYQRLKTGLRLVGYRLWRLSHRFIRVFGVSFPAMKQLQFAATVAAVGEYEPQPLSVPTVVLRPGDWPAGLFEDANKRWKSLAGNHFQVHTAAFDAADLRPPDNIQSLGFVLGVCLSSAQAATANHTRS